MNIELRLQDITVWWKRLLRSHTDVLQGLAVEDEAGFEDGGRLDGQAEAVTVLVGARGGEDRLELPAVAGKAFGSALHGDAAQQIIGVGHRAPPAASSTRSRPSPSTRPQGSAGTGTMPAHPCGR
ncbi:hypothetical protein [Streptomyces sp. CRN 30]|uniref:hypothetical protein n=1 Tax=Streptomyces sp. CRN 30 TaxID=3075613 RepID=UPI002A7EFD13|nr:hypothetical protein [Streptomyces sp. CRN 30]